MKTLLSIGAALAIAVDAFATGFVPIDSPQSGFVNFTNGGNQMQTNQFVVNFSHPPTMTFFLISSITNCLPLTNNSVTISNFVVSTASGAGAATNATIAWTANPGYLKWQTGTNLTLANVATNIAFATPYSQLPFVDVQPFGTTPQTNFPVAVTAVTLTNFTVTGIGVATFMWEAWGVSSTTGTWPATY